MPELTKDAAKERSEGTAMQIEITGETERLIQAALAVGKFASVEEFISNGNGIKRESVAIHYRRCPIELSYPRY